jgi:general stress protein YciG
MSSTNPSNFANLPKDELREIAAKGGHASHGGHSTESTESTSGHADRNPDGTFTKGSELAKELGAQGGHAAHHESATGNEGVRTTPWARTTDTEVLI